MSNQSSELKIIERKNFAMECKALINIKNLFVEQNKSLNDVSILIENDIIKEISPDPHETFSLENDQIVDIKDNFLIPGLIDGHTHPIFSGSRAFEIDYKLQGMTYSQITERGGGINYTTNLTRKATKEELRANLLQFCNSVLSYGTTTAEIKTGYHLNIEGELSALEIINEVQQLTPVTLIPTFLGAHLVPAEFKGKEEDYVQKLLEIMPEVKKQGIARFTDVFCDKGAFTVDQTLEMIEESKNVNIPVRIHGEELVRTGIASESAKRFKGKWVKSIDHMLKANEEDFKVLAKNDVTATFMPIGPIVLFEPEWQNYNMLKKTGVNIGLGSDFNPNSWFYSMQLVISFATYLMHIPPAIALASATNINAKSLLEDQRGTIEIGKKADLVELSAKDQSEISYQIGGNLVKRVFKNGKMVVER